VKILTKDEIINNDVERILSYWVIDFLENFSHMIEESPKFLELRPINFNV